MAELQCRVERSPADPEAVRLALVNKDAKSVSFIDLDGSSVERLILGLAALRGKLADPVPDSLDPHPMFDKASVSTEPSFKIFGRAPGNCEAGTVPLGLRHPGIGWLLYLFSAGRAAALGRALTNEAKRQSVAGGETGSRPH